jgi:hypothetical protein
MKQEQAIVQRYEKNMICAKKRARKCKFKKNKQQYSS